MVERCWSELHTVAKALDRCDRHSSIRGLVDLTGNAFAAAKLSPETEAMKVFLSALYGALQEAAAREGDDNAG